MVGAVSPDPMTTRRRGRAHAKKPSRAAAASSVGHPVRKLRVDVVVRGREPVGAQARRRRVGARLRLALGGRARRVARIGEHEQGGRW